MRPTSVVSVSLPMPTTTVMKMIGAITIRTSLTKPIAERVHLLAERRVEMAEQRRR